MKRLLWASAACAVALAVVPWLAFAQTPAPEAARGAQDFVFLTEARPLLVRVRAHIDGKPVQAGWGDFLNHLFRDLDRNGDGVLDQAEAACAPSLGQILNGSPGASFGGFGGGGEAPPSLNDLDTNKDGKVTPAELAAYYRAKGFTPFQFEVETPGGNPIAAFIGNGNGQPTVKAVRETVFALLDADKDGKLTRAELAAAPDVLLALDTNVDEMVTVREVVPNAAAQGGGMPGMMAKSAWGKAAPITSNKMLMLVTSPGQAPADLVPYMQKRYGTAAAEGAKLSRNQLGLDVATFAALDANRDGVLDATELAGFVRRPPDLEILVRLGTKDETERRLEVIPASGHAGVFAGKLRTTAELALLDLGATRAELCGGKDGYQADVLAGVVRQQFGAQFKQADKDNNGYLDEKEAQGSALFRNSFKAMDRDGDGKVYEKEFTAYLDHLKELQTRAMSACVTLVLKDQSRGLFDLLDVNRDGRLSVREMRGAVGLLGQRDGGKGYLTAADLPPSYRVTVRRGPARKASFDPLSIVRDLYGGRNDDDAPEATEAGPAWFRKMDRNRDGDVSRREWLGSEALFRRIDADGDGLISAAEAERYDALVRPRN